MDAHAKRYGLHHVPLHVDNQTFVHSWEQQ